MPMKMAPNFEITMYLAQATGACIVTDSFSRWREFSSAAQRGVIGASPLEKLNLDMERTGLFLPTEVHLITSLHSRGNFRAYPRLLGRTFKYLSSLYEKPEKSNVEDGLCAEFNRIRVSTARAEKRYVTKLPIGKVSCLWPKGGIQDNNVNRLLLMSNSEHHLPSAPMALFIRDAEVTEPKAATSQRGS